MNVRLLSSLCVALLLAVGGSAPARAENFQQSKTINLNGNYTWSFNDDCTKALALWPSELSPGKEWKTQLPGQAVTFSLAAMSVDTVENPSCAAIQSSGGASGNDNNRTLTLQVDAEGDGTYAPVTWPYSFTTPSFQQRVEPYRISAYWEYSYGLRIVNEYWIYVGNVSSISINNSQQFTTIQDVNLSITPPPGSATMQVSNDAGFGDAQSFAAQSNVTWKLSSPIDAKISKNVYCRFFDRDGALISTLSDDIILDAFLPTVSKATAVVTTGTTQVKLSSSKKAKKFKLSVSASDNLSGLSSMQVATVAQDTKAKTLPFVKTLKITALPSTKIYLRVQDLAGNWSSWKSIKSPK